MKLRVVDSIKKYGVLVAVLAVGFACAPHAVSALYTKAQLETKLQNGFQTALDLDALDPSGSGDSCKEVTNLAKNNNASIATLRTAYINQGYAGHSPASYKFSTWLSKKGAPNTTNPVLVSVGATSLDLQINDMIMLCGDLVQPDVGTSCTSLPVSSMYDDNRWVTDLNPDTKPNPYGGTCLQPARTGNFTRVESIEVTSSPNLKGTVSLTPPSYLSISRDENSRYWFANPVLFTYRFDSPVTTGGDIKLKLKTKKIARYRESTYRCAPVVSDLSGPNDFSRCVEYTDEVSLRISVPAQYNLMPSVSLLPGNSVSIGQNVGVTGKVENTTNVNSANTNWRVSRMVYAPGQSPPVSIPADGDQDPCQAFSGYKAGSCSADFMSGSKVFPARSTDSLGPKDSTVNEEMGSKICFATSVSTPTTLPNPKWRHSKLSCVTVGKQPKVHIWGGDLRVGGKIDTSNTNISEGGSRWFGSWSEYGTFIGGSNVNVGGRFGSGAVLANGSTPVGQLGTNPLTFANTNGNDYIGQYGTLDINDSLASSLVQINLPTGSSLSTLASGKYKSTGNLTIQGTVQLGNTVVIDATGYKVTIAGDINYAVGATSIDQLPQLIIKAKEFVINDNVKTVDAWLLGATSGSGTFKTCSTPQSSITSNTCADQLKINGSSSTSQLSLYRTAGSDKAESAELIKPAEIFNLRADAYLWRYSQASKTFAPQTVQVTELPPRY